ncbi:1-deoxy-D-xylulose-5-phosphate synthase N-terminal domain-containing protein, partial [Methylobacterium sp. J-090]|uniref:1-deoxy-D-xylulose-5-phosphate synthase N-terminal domain-containing protein n=1 Tax=Methylobacterium sp. J-090 TaxID=2836666 RepID=UPI001FBB369C
MPVSSANTSILDGLSETSALRLLPESDLPAVAEAVRAEMIEAVSVTGGHLGSGL